MPDIASPELSVEAARNRLGFEEGDSLEDCLSKWRKVEARLAWMAQSSDSPAAKSSFERDLDELRNLIQAATAKRKEPKEAQSELVREEVQKAAPVPQKVLIPGKAPEKKRKRGLLKFVLIQDFYQVKVKQNVL